MVTMETANSVLKDFYLDAVAEQLNEQVNPFFARIKKTTANVTGKDVVKLVKTTRCGGIGARDEGGDVPTMPQMDYVNFVVPLKNIYGSIEISDKAIRASANNEGAFVNLLEDEMNALVKSAQFNFSRMLFGDGSGKLAKALSCTGVCITLDNIALVEEGMEVDFYSDDGLIASKKKIKSVDRLAGCVYMEGFSLDSTTLSENVYLYAHDSKDKELTGLGAIFSDMELYGVDRSYSLMRPYQERDVGVLDEFYILAAMDRIEENSGSKVNLILCSWGVRRALIAACRENHILGDIIRVDYDNSVLTFNGVPVVADRFCPSGTMYLLNTDDFKLCQLCDWQWLQGEDGKVLKQVAGKTSYTATLVKYAELICERPCAQGVLTQIDEA